MADFETVTVAMPSNGVARITLNRPDKRNAQDMQMIYDLNAAVDRAIADDAVKVIILDAAGDHFSSGHDLGGDGGKTWRDFPIVGTWAGFDAPGSEALMSREREIYLDMTQRLRKCSKPTIAAVQGWCIAGGLMLAWACDLLIASDDAQFMDPVMDLGVAGVEYFAHPWELGTRKAKEFLFLGEPIDAYEAHRLGMVNRVVARSELTDVTLAIGEKIAAKPSFALKIAKESVNAMEETMGRERAMHLAFYGHLMCHAHNKDLFGVIIDPNGLPGKIRETVIKRIEEEFDPVQRDRALKNLGVRS